MKNLDINKFMRSIHRDIGFLVIGITIIYALSGITLIYRDTDFLKNEKTIEKKLSPNLETSELGKELHMRRFKATKIEGDIVYFDSGTYNSSTGMANYTQISLPSFFEKLNSFHKQPSKNPTHLLSTIFGVLLVILAITSFWMYKPSNKKFRRGIILASLGVVAAIIIILI